MLAASGSVKNSVGALKVAVPAKKLREYTGCVFLDAKIQTIDNVIAAAATIAVIAAIAAIAAVAIIAAIAAIAVIAVVATIAAVIAAIATITAAIAAIATELSIFLNRRIANIARIEHARMYSYIVCRTCGRQFGAYTKIYKTMLARHNRGETVIAGHIAGSAEPIGYILDALKLSRECCRVAIMTCAEFGDYLHAAAPVAIPATVKPGAPGAK